MNLRPEESDLETGLWDSFQDESDVDWEQSFGPVERGISVNRLDLLSDLHFAAVSLLRKHGGTLHRDQISRRLRREFPRLRFRPAWLSRVLNNSSDVRVRATAVYQPLRRFRIEDDEVEWNRLVTKYSENGPDTEEDLGFFTYSENAEYAENGSSSDRDVLFEYYMAELSTLPILNAAQERSHYIANELRIGLAEIKNGGSGRTDGTLLVSDVLRYLVNNIEKVEWLLKELGVRSDLTLIRLMEHEGFNAAVRSEMSTNQIQKAASDFSCSHDEIQEALKKLDVHLNLIPPSSLRVFGNYTLARMKRRLDEVSSSDFSEEERSSLTTWYDRIEARGATSRRHLIESNLRLVMHWAKKYRRKGLEFFDIVQEGNIGLMTAVDRFDLRKGFTFSTYASWWIRQGIMRAIADTDRIIRIPVHGIDTLNKIDRYRRIYFEENEVEPSPKEIADDVGATESQVTNLMKAAAQEPMSWEQLAAAIPEYQSDYRTDHLPESTVEAEELTLADVLEAPMDRSLGLENRSDHSLLKTKINEVFSTLKTRESEIIKMRLGFGDGRSMTLEKVGREFGVTRERIRQIESHAFRKMRHPTRSRKLKHFYESDSTFTDEYQSNTIVLIDLGAIGTQRVPNGNSSFDTEENIQEQKVPLTDDRQNDIGGVQTSLFDNPNVSTELSAQNATPQDLASPPPSVEITASEPEPQAPAPEIALEDDPDLPNNPDVFESRTNSSNDSDECTIEKYQARQMLIKYREQKLRDYRLRNVPRSQGLLRKSMLDALIATVPKSREEFIKKIPQSLRVNTEIAQIEEHLEPILDILRHVNPD